MVCVCLVALVAFALPLIRLSVLEDYVRSTGGQFSYISPPDGYKFESNSRLGRWYNRVFRDRYWVTCGEDLKLQEIQVIIAYCTWVRVIRLDFPETPITDRELALTSNISTIEALFFNGSRISADGLSDLGRLQDLRRLGIWESAFDADALRAIGKLSDLEYLGIKNSELDEDGISEMNLSRMKHLQSLDFVDTQLGDDSLVAIGSCPRLETLDLCFTNITDAGLTHLEKLTTLETLYLEGKKMRVSRSGVESLSRKLPQCAIIIRGGVLQAGVWTQQAEW